MTLCVTSVVRNATHFIFRLTYEYQYATHLLQSSCSILHLLKLFMCLIKEMPFIDTVAVKVRYTGRSGCGVCVAAYFQWTSDSV